MKEKLKQELLGISDKRHTCKEEGNIKMDLKTVWTWNQSPSVSLTLSMSTIQPESNVRLS